MIHREPPTVRRRPELPELRERSVKVTCVGGRQKFVGGTQLDVGLVEKKEEWKMAQNIYVNMFFLGGVDNFLFNTCVYKRAQYLGSWAASALVLPNLEWEKKSFSIGGFPVEFFLGLCEIANRRG